MRVLIFLSLIFTVVFMLGLDIVLWTEDPLYGIGGVVGMIAYFVAYAISGDMTIAPRDFWRLSRWQVFKKKMGYAFSAYLAVTLIVSGVLATILS